MNDNKKRIRLIVYSGIIAALYAVLTLPMAQFAFGPIQFRLAEVLTVLLVIVGIPFILLLEKNSRLKSLVEKL